LQFSTLFLEVAIWFSFTLAVGPILFQAFFSMIVYVHIFSVVILFTMEQERNDGGHQCGQQGEQQGVQNVRSSPRLSEKRKAEDLKILRERRKSLKLPTQPPASAAEDKVDEQEHDEDFTPDGEGSRHDDGVLATMMPPWLLSVMVIRANSSHNLCDAP
jgi:hypothetical protein